MDEAIDDACLTDSGVTYDNELPVEVWTVLLIHVIVVRLK